MKFLILFCALGTISAIPEGYFRQEYQYKKSSSTYKNNQLQSQNEDEGFYKKQGDLEGKAGPQVEQHNEEREFVGPNQGNMGYSATSYDTRDLTNEAENVFTKHQLRPNDLQNPDGTLGGARAYSSYSSYSSTSDQGRQSPTYVTQSNLGHLTRNVEREISDELQEAISKYQRQNSYRTQTMSSYELRILENELKANITRQLQDALNRQYGNQQRRGDFSYSVLSSGSYSPTANYDNQELSDLKAQIEEKLLKELREKITIQTVRRDSAEIDDLTTHGRRHPERITEPHYQTKGHRTSSSTSNSNTYASSSNGYRNNYQPVTYVESRPRIVVRPSVSLTDVVQNAQNDLSQQINNALSTFEERYTSSSYQITGSRPDYQTSLERFKNELRRNVTQLLEEQLERNYGRQDLREGYYFPSGSQTIANYRTEDLDHLKQQMENNLYKHLENSLRQVENRLVTRSQSSSSSSSYYTTSNRDYNRQQPTYTQHLTNENSSPVYYRPNGYVSPTTNTNTQSSYGSTYERNHRYPQTTYSTNTNENAQLQSIRNELQENMNKQIQAALRKQESVYGSSSYSTQNHRDVTDRLTEELKRNLTAKLDETLRSHYGNQGVKGGYSYTVSASGSLNPNANYNSQDMNRLTQQLQDDLVRQLEDQLNKQQSSYSQSQYSSSSSYSGGSSYNPSSNYRPLRYTSGGNYGTQGSSLQKYNRFSTASSSSSDVAGEDCMQNDARTLEDDAQKLEDVGFYSKPQPVVKPKSANMMGYKPHNAHQIIEIQHTQEMDRFVKPKTDDLGQQVEDLGQQVEDLGQQVEDAGQQIEDLEQQEEDSDYVNQFSEGQQTSNNYEPVGKLMQQPENERGSYTKPKNNKPSSSAQHRGDIEQETEELGQQTEDLGQQTEDLGQQTEELGQQIEELGQQTEDLTQQVEDHYGSFSQKVDEDRVLGQQSQDFTQQTEDLTQELHQQSENLNQQSQVFNEQNHRLTQQAESMTQQSEDFNHNTNLLSGSYQPKQPSNNDRYVPYFNSFTRPQNNRQQNMYNAHSSYLQRDLNKHIEDSQPPKDLTHQTEDLTQKAQLFTQQTQDMSQQTQDMSQQTQDMSQQTEDLAQQTEDLTQQTEDLTQQREDLTQQTEDLMQQTEDLSQQSEDFFQRGHNKLTNSNTKPQSSSQVTRQMTELMGMLDQQIAIQKQEKPNVVQVPIQRDFIDHGDYLQVASNKNDLDNNQQQLEDDFSILKQTDYVKLSDLDRLSQNKPTTHSKPYNYIRATTVTYPTYNSGYHYGSPRQVVENIEETDDLQEQEVERQTAQVAEQKPNSYSPSGIVHEVHANESEETETTTEISKSFWQKMGGKISTTYNTAKNKAKDLADKIG